MPEEPPNQLEYATPSRSDYDEPDRTAVGCLSPLAAVVGAGSLLIGVGWVIKALRRSNRSFPSDESDTGAVGIAIGLVALAAAYRWHRASRK